MTRIISPAGIIYCANGIWTKSSSEIVNGVISNKFRRDETKIAQTDADENNNFIANANGMTKAKLLIITLDLKSLGAGLKSRDEKQNEKYCKKKKNKYQTCNARNNSSDCGAISSSTSS